MGQLKLLKKRKTKRYIFLGSLLFILTLAVILNLSVSANGVDLKDINKIFINDENFNMILYNIRLPRIVVAILAGGLLGLSGAVMQGSLKNPLASPFTLGISQAAAFGASFAIIVLEVYSKPSFINSNFEIALCAFFASLICMAAILLFAKISSLTPNAMLLAGVGLGSLFHALTMFLQYFADDLQVGATLFWTFGELGKANWEIIKIMAIVFIPIYICFITSHWKMDALSFGDDSAKSRGVNVDIFRFVSLFLASLLSAVAVSFLGIIGFIGLVAPHIVKLILGNSHFSILVFSPLVGAVLLLLADFVSKIVLLPLILPIGILTSFMGVPIFLYLLLRGSKSA